MPAATRPIELYRHALDEAGFESDPQQQAAIDALDEIHDRLISNGHRYRGWNRFKTQLTKNGALVPERGLYLWGGVGRGKTHLMDMFFRALPMKGKRRSHFHRFMFDLHDQLNAMQQQSDPLATIADDIASETQVICFDEFFVSDIADAMLLGTLFSELFRRGVTLVATSNVAPSDLYRDGLQRERFLPAIDMIERHCQVMELKGDHDYRLRALTHAPIYLFPLDQQAEETLAKDFARISCNGGKPDQPLTICGRKLRTRRLANGVVWFDFAELCEGPRSQNDYIELARVFHTVLLSDIPALEETKENAARRFIALIDEFYDHNVKLIVSAAVAMDALYQGERLRFEFKRTLSRLTEMQSSEYLHQPHLA